MIFTIKDCSIDTDTYEVRRQGVVVPVEPQVFDLLIQLLQNAGRVVTKDEIIARVWKGRTVSDAALSSRIKAARRAIGDDGSAQDLIRTIPRRGFRLVGVVTETAGPPHCASRSERAERPAGPAPASTADAHTPRASTVGADRPPANGPSLVVLPFRCLGEAGRMDLLEGVVEAVRSGLARIKTFFVVARGSAEAFGAGDMDVAAIASLLGVRYVVQGSMHVSGDALRIAVQLTDAVNRQEIWSAPFASRLGETFEVQDKVTQAIVGVLQPAILSAEITRAQRRQPHRAFPGKVDTGFPKGNATNIESGATAYDLVLRAMPMCWALNQTDCSRAMPLLAEAVRLDPDYALAHALLSWCHGQHAVYNWTDRPEIHRQRALGMARRAAHFDNDDPLVLNMLASAECVAGDIPGAAARVGRALELDPNSAWGWIRSGYIHCDLAKPDLALADFDRALRLSPHDPMRHNTLIGMGFAHLIAERYGEAISHIERGLIENPDAVWAHRELAAAAAMAGDRQKASRSVAIVENYSPSVSVAGIVDAIPIRCDRLRTRFGAALTLAGFKA